MSQQRRSNVFPYWFPPSFYRHQYWAFGAWNILGLLPVQQNIENHHSATSWKWMLLPSNTTHSHFKHISHVGLVFQTQACTLSVPDGLAHLLSAGFDESFQWISASKSAAGGSRGGGSLYDGGKVRSSNEPHGSVVYVHRSTPAFCHPGTLFSAASLVGEQGKGGTCTFVQVYVCLRRCLSDCAWSHLCASVVISLLKSNRGIGWEMNGFFLIPVCVYNIFQQKKKSVQHKAQFSTIHTLLHFQSR